MDNNQDTGDVWFRERFGRVPAERALPRRGRVPRVWSEVWSR